jgi:ferredoxin-nitrite reductase
MARCEQQTSTAFAHAGPWTTAAGGKTRSSFVAANGLDAPATCQRASSAARPRQRKGAIRAAATGDQYLAPEALERAKKGNNFEKMKLKKCGSALWTEVHELQQLLREGKTDFKDLEDDDLETRLKWAGLFHRKKRTPGKFMMRLKVPNGILNSEQMRYFVRALERYGDDACIDITTRMNIQLRGIELTEAGDILSGLYDVGLTALMSGMDNVRNMVGSPIAGIDPLELVDTRPLCKAINDMITNDRKGRADLANMPRKFNICVSGSRDDFAHTHINDIGLVPVANPARGGEIGFNVVVGGFFSIKRNAEAIPLDAWVAYDDVVDFCEAALLYFRDHGDRKNRQATRLMYMLDQWGTEGFRDGVTEYMAKLAGARRRGDGFTLERAVVPPEAGHGQPWVRRDVTGVHPQKQAGLCWVSANVPGGRLSLQDMLDLADIADKYSGGEMRLTVEQNILFPNVRASSSAPSPAASNGHAAHANGNGIATAGDSGDTVEAMLREPIFGKFRVSPGVLVGGLVSCTGSQFCGLALIETKNRAIALARQLDAVLELPRPVRMHWTGCRNSCGQVQVADIGLMGAPARNAAGKAVEGVDIYVGGRIGEDARLGDVAVKGVPCDPEVLVPTVQALLIERFGATLRTPTADDDEHEVLAAAAAAAAAGTGNATS